MTIAVEYPFPLRKDFTARLILPRDLTLKEVARLAAMMRTLVRKSQEGRKP